MSQSDVRVDAVPHYTEGVCEDGVAILRDGVPMTVSDILATLNATEEALMGKRVFFEVSFELPQGASTAEARRYVLNAVTAERGLLHPDEPMAEIDRASISVKKLVLERA